jgi:hypothetical protein
MHTFHFPANAPHWARYFYDQLSRYGGPKVTPIKIDWRAGKRANGGFDVIVPESGMWLAREKWSQYLDCAAVFAARKTLKEGERVQSCYQRRWSGTIFGPGFAHSGCLLVKVTHDARGRALRKPMFKELDEHWLKPCGS